MGFPGETETTHIPDEVAERAWAARDDAAGSTHPSLETPADQADEDATSGTKLAKARTFVESAFNRLGQAATWRGSNAPGAGTRPESVHDLASSMTWHEPTFHTASTNLGRHESLGHPAWHRRRARHARLQDPADACSPAHAGATVAVAWCHGHGGRRGQDDHRDQPGHYVRPRPAFAGLFWWISISTDQKSRTYLGMEFGKGIAEYLLGEANLDDILYSPGVDGLTIVPNGRPLRDGSELLATPRMTDLVKYLESMQPARTVIYDLPPLLMSDDVLVFSPHMDCVLDVVAVGVTPRASLLRSQEILSELNVVGVVLNRATEQDHSGSYYY
jgi:hypothetical protein